MSTVESYLPLYSNQKPFPFIKLCKKYVPFLTISILLTLSIFCYLFVPQIRISSNGGQRSWSSMWSSDNSDTSSETSSVTARTRLTPGINTYTQTERTVTINNRNRRIFKDNVNQLRTSRYLWLPSGADANATVRAQRDFVKNMMKEAWDNYAKYAWGENELKPVSRTGHTSDIFGGDSKLGATIVDSLDTLYIMNMTTEFESGREWVQKNLRFDTLNSPVSVFETVIRFVGGLLTAYAFTNDVMFLQKAKHVAEHMLPAFNTPTGLPHSLINPMTGQSQNYGWASGGSSILAEFGSLHLEFVYLSSATGDPKFAQKVTKIREFMDKMTKPYEGLYINYINPSTGQWGEDSVSIGALGDSYYEYLIKSWVQSNGTDLLARRLYDKAIEAIDKRLVKKSRNGLTYLAKMSFGQLEHKMEHLACFSGGMFALGARDEPNERKKQYYQKLGANLTDTCAQSYLRTATHIGPEAFYFTDNEEAVALNSGEMYYILRPEVIESYFYLWRLTHDQRFRDYAWSATQAIARHCRTGTGFSGIRNVNNSASDKDDVQQTFFLAETLKYLYLIFSSDDLISLNDWVLNTEAHPFPVLKKTTVPTAHVRH